MSQPTDDKPIDAPDVEASATEPQTAPEEALPASAASEETGEETSEQANETWWWPWGEPPEWFWNLFSVCFFVGGFLFDALTLGRYINLWTLSYVGVYAAGVAVFKVVLAHGWLDRWRHWVEYGMHFCLGATFSALVVLYFRSASHLWALGTVGILALAMVVNEFAAQKGAKDWVIWAIYASSLVMFFNFLFPYALGTLSRYWFYLSIGLVLSFLYLIRGIARIPRKAMGASTTFSFALIGLFWVGAIPPVPLVMKQNFVCVGARKVAGEYVCRSGDRRPWWYLGTGERVVHYRDGERVSTMSAVSAPRGVSTHLEHRWYHWDENRGDWKRYDTIDVHLEGGRKKGWRFYSYKRNMLPGRWRVDTAVPGGAVLSYVTFTAEPVKYLPHDRHRRKLR